MSEPEDQRRHPRVAQRIRVRSDFRGAVELETIDLSVGGLCCTAPLFLPPMTRLAVSLVLPPHGGSPHLSEQVVQGEAVVVRSEPSSATRSVNGAHRVALFFSRMEEADRQKLLQFLEGR